MQGIRTVPDKIIFLSIILILALVPAYIYSSFIYKYSQVDYSHTVSKNLQNIRIIPEDDGKKIDKSSLTFFTEKVSQDLDLNIHNVEEMKKILMELSHGAMSLEIIGNSFLGKDIYIGKFGKGKKIILIIGGHHGYESISTGLPLFMMKALSAEEINIPENLSIWIIPLLNPDGFSQNQRTNARGIDLNRNYPQSTWNTIGVDNGIYNAGPQPFSEPETQLIQNLMKNITFELVVSYHSNKQTVESNSIGGKYPGLMNLVRQMAEITKYQVLDLTKLKKSEIATSGDLTMWLDEAYNTPAITVELGDETWEKTWERNSPTLGLMMDWVINKDRFKY